MFQPDVTYVFDEGFAYPSLISAFSILRHRPAEVIIRFMTAGDIPGFAARLGALRAAFPEAELIHAPIDSNPSLEVQGHVSPTTLARLKLPYLLEKPTLYLDGDTLIRRDIGPLFEIDCTQHPVGAVRDAGILKAMYHQTEGKGPTSRKTLRHISDMKKLGDLVSLERYFNAGVLMLNLPLIRELGLDRQMADQEAAVALRKKHQLRFNDQNWMNVVFGKSALLLPPEWNALWGNRMTASAPFPAPVRQSFEASRRDPAIMHYTGRICPWDVRYPVLYPKRRPWVAEYKSVQRQADAVLA